MSTAASPDFTTAEARFAIETMQEASRLVTQIQSELVATALTKDDRSPVTVADFACQALVAYRLMQAFPADALLAEEDSSSLRLHPETLREPIETERFHGRKTNPLEVSSGPEIRTCPQDHISLLEKKAQ